MIDWNKIKSDTESKQKKFGKFSIADIACFALIEAIDSMFSANARAESAEASAAQLETDNDEMQSYINEIRVALHTEKDELTIDAVRRVISERDELARKLEQAQQALIAVRDWFARNTKQGHTPGPTEKIVIDAIGSE